jgi:transcriptional regulator with PAS, ATPase and Fis domain
MVSSKLFRRDLYYRLNVVPIQILPLRGRREDILALILHFLDKFNRVCGQKRVLSPEVVEALYQYDFPGNVRELANLLERFVVLSEKDRIEKEDLPKAITAFRPTHEEGSGKPSEDLPLKEALEKYECFIINRAMKKYGSQKEVAKILKVAQATISRKMKKYLVSENDTEMNINIQ